MNMNNSFLHPSSLCSCWRKSNLSRSQLCTPPSFVHRDLRTLGICLLLRGEFSTHSQGLLLVWRCQSLFFRTLDADYSCKEEKQETSRKEVGVLRKSITNENLPQDNSKNLGRQFVSLTVRFKCFNEKQCCLLSLLFSLSKFGSLDINL